ncbi:MAG TPA: fimbria/pilus periplasmic chaperone, partial [Candidatus Manganitrophaceae bacterium]
MFRPLLLFLILLISLFPRPLYAGSFKVVPIKLFLDAKTKTSAVTVTNNSNEKVTLQLEALEWSQNEKGEDFYAPTKEILFFPKIFSLEKNEEKIVRVGYQGPPSGGREKTYRLYFEELPVSKPGETAIKMALRIGVPIFITPLKELKEKAIENMEFYEGRLRVKIKNGGNRHFIVGALHATGLDLSGAEV